MCSNYVPVTDGDRLLAFFGVHRDPHKEIPSELYPTRVGPFIRLVNGQREYEAGYFGMMPPWRREVAYGKHTYNSKSETVHALPSFKDAWRRGLRCVIPAEAVYEPRYYEDLTNERWRIEREDGQPFGAAGVYNQWVENGVEMFSYTMLTVNCDDHPFYNQFHAPDKEKRMPIFLDPEQYDTWMSCPMKEAPGFFRQWMGAFKGAPEPRAKRAPVAPKEPKAPASSVRARTPKPPPPPPPVQGGLF